MKFRIPGVVTYLLISMLAVAPRSSSAQTNQAAQTGLARCTTPVPREGKAYDRFMLLNQRAQQSGKDAKIIFIGDSITEGWESNGKAVWAKYYAARGALNLGIGSDHTQHVLWRLQNGNIDGLNPRLAVVLIGVNNTPDTNNSPADILAGIHAVLDVLQKRLPQAEILLLGILPFREHFNWQRGKALQVNQALAELDGTGRVHYLDVGHVFIDTHGDIPKELMRDFLHPSPEGYRLWAKDMEPVLARIMGESPMH